MPVGEGVQVGGSASPEIEFGESLWFGQDLVWAQDHDFGLGSKTPATPHCLAAQSRHIEAVNVVPKRYLKIFMNE